MTGRITLEELHTSLKSYIDSKKVTSVATQSANGLMSASDKKKLDGIATGANNYTHPSTHDASMITQSASYRFVTDTEKSTWNAKASTTVATTSANGLMAAVDKTKLDGIATGANKYTHPSTHAATMITEDETHRFVTDAEKTAWNSKPSSSVASTTANGLMSKEDKAKLNGVAAGANNYVHPANHAASMITQSASYRFVTDTEKSTWNAKASTTAATQSANGLMSAADKKKLDGIATGANNYTHPTNHDASMITQSASYRFVTDTEKSTWNAKASTAVATTSANGLMAAADKTKLNGIATGANNYTHPSTHAASMITQSASYRFVTDTEKSTWNAKASTAVATQSANGLMAASDKKKLDYLNKLMVAVSTFAELKSAVTAASSQPTMIFVKAGTYNFTETLYLPSYTRLVGVGEVIFQSSSSSVNCYICNKSDGTSGAYTAAYDIVVENITFEGLNRVTALTPLCFGHASHIQIIDCTFRNLHVWHMLELNAVENAMVYNCAFDNYGNTGSAYTEAVQLDGAVSGGPFPWFGPYDNTGCRDIEFNSCRWSNIGGKCIGNHTFVEGMPVQNVKFINNTIYKADTVLNLSDVQGMVCSGNYAEDCNFFINCTNQKNDVYNIFVDNNEFYGRYKGSTISETEGRFIGINIAGNGSGKKCKKLIVTNNSINDIWFHGIGFTMDDVVISNNIFRRVWKNGIYAYGGWSVSITSNLFYETAYEADSRGAIVIGNSSVLTQYVIVANNNVQNRNRIIIGSNTSKCIVANNIGAVVNNGGSALVSNTGNYEL